MPLKQRKPAEEPSSPPPDAKKKKKQKKKQQQQQEDEAPPILSRGNVFLFLCLLLSISTAALALKVVNPPHWTLRLTDRWAKLPADPTQNGLVPDFDETTFFKADKNFVQDAVGAHCVVWLHQLLHYAAFQDSTAGASVGPIACPERTLSRFVLPHLPKTYRPYIEKPKHTPCFVKGGDEYDTQLCKDFRADVGALQRWTHGNDRILAITVAFGDEE